MALSAISQLIIKAAPHIPKAKKGLTLLWPAEWTHIHKGNVLKSGLKYIITGWMHINEQK